VSPRPSGTPADTGRSTGIGSGPAASARAPDEPPNGPDQGGDRPRTLRNLSEISVTRLRGLAQRKATALAELGIESVFDLLTTYPYRYIDRSRRADLAGLAVGDEAVVLATVGHVSSRRIRQGRSLVEVTVHDGTAGMKVAFFNQPWRARQLGVGAEVLLFGTLDTFRGSRQMVNPVVDVVVGGDDPSDGADVGRRRTLRIIPVYPASARVGLSSWEIGGWVEQAIRRAGRLADPLPVEWRDRLGLIGRDQAMRDIHLPSSLQVRGPARRRLAFDELFRLQLALVLRRRALELGSRAIRHRVSPLDVVSSTASPAGGRRSPRRGRSGTALAEVEAGRSGLPPDATLVQRFLSGLPFALTAAQRKALAAIFAELAGPLPMHRLLQGDVGSGKTVVAVAALLAAVQGGHQGALMVPTEVLAEQHAIAVRALCAGLYVPSPDRLGGERPVTVALLTNRTTATERAPLHAGLRDGSVDVVVGTHALLTDEVRFHSLGVVVIDEQHRFGVEQRAALRDKGRSSVLAQGEAGGADPASGDADADPGGAGGPGGPGADPDLLVMTATPIPRTAAMVLFGDLDMVVLDELPPGRTQVITEWARTAEAEAVAWDRVRTEVAVGHRAYVVCPLVEGSEKVQARSATEERDRLAGGPLAGLRVGLLHGQMPAKEKEAVMAAFRNGEVDVLVATTVVEVGVDVPEATVMVVEDAERFGIAQLHQLRGRVGRSHRQSWCYLLGAGASEDAAERLAAVERTTDGFALAEVDLELRGEGTILGARQKGRSDLRLATLRGDADLLDAARQVAEAITEGDPQLASHPVLADEVRLFLDAEEEAFLFKS
jgi:ATP-dependent DNA helicase RecG